MYHNILVAGRETEMKFVIGLPVAKKNLIKIKMLMDKLIVPNHFSKSWAGREPGS